MNKGIALSTIREMLDSVLQEGMSSYESDNVEIVSMYAEMHKLKDKMDKVGIVQTESMSKERLMEICCTYIDHDMEYTELSNVMDTLIDDCGCTARELEELGFYYDDYSTAVDIAV